MIKQICFLSNRLFTRRVKAIIRQESLFPFSSQYDYKINSNLSNNLLPKAIESDCQRWESALKENLKLKMENHPWLDINLKCSDIFLHSRSSKLFISTENILKNLTPKQREDLSQILKVNSSIYLQISNDNNEQFIFPGIVVNVFNEGFTVYLNRLIDDQDLFLNKNVQIRLSGTKTNLAQLEFLNNRNNWHTLPGFELLLYAYKCNKMGQIDRKIDPLELIKSEDFNADDERLAIAAALNLKRNIVAVHVGGMARTRLLTKYLNILTRENKNIHVALISPQVDQLYLMSRYYEVTGRTNFLSLQKLDQKLLQKLVNNPSTREVILRKSVEPGRGTLVEDSIKQEDNIIFMGHSNSILNIFTYANINFDVVILDGAERRSEIGSWQAILSLSSCARIFGDYPHLKRKFTTLVNKSLIQRLDESFGEEVNFHIYNPRYLPRC